MFNFIPLTGTRRKVTDLQRHVRVGIEIAEKELSRLVLLHPLPLKITQLVLQLLALAA